MCKCSPWAKCGEAGIEREVNNVKREGWGAKNSKKEQHNIRDHKSMGEHLVSPSSVFSHTAELLLRS